MASESPTRAVEHEEQNRQKKEFLAPRRGDRVEGARDHESRGQEHEDHRDGGLSDGKDGFQDRDAVPGSERSDEQHHRNDHQVSKDIDPDEEPAVRRIQLTAFD